MRAIARALLALAPALVLTAPVGAAEAPAEPTTPSEILAGLELRAIGPAVMGGRIADVVVSPADRATWYVAVGSGGVWKTTNAGITWTPVFDAQTSYSIGTLALDPSNPDVVWVGTGENVSGRHVGWGDGVYRSRDGGATWENLGLKDSQHVGRILVDPRDGDTVWVAAEGPLWSSGGERGVYKTVDGGRSWKRVLAIDENTGVTDLEMDPRDPDVLYAAAYERRRHVWSFLAGGPGSGIWKSTDGGESWRELTEGLPQGDAGKIGLAVSPVDPDVVYATIEAVDPEEQGFYRSPDRGERWERRSEYVSGGTGPHYYQEIEASPVDVDTVYQMDVFLHVTRDGGKSFSILETGREKHSDNHALAIDPEHPAHMLVGTDGGLYESWDEGATWRHFGNLPISQFYKLAIDGRVPFASVLGGAQDLGTLLGPIRTDSTEGVRNGDWSIPLGADGYACAFDPENPDIAYMEIQVGNLVRYDRRNHEAIDIQPQPGPGDPPERWNWDSPILVSPHAASRLYYGSQRLWRSDDRGSSWRPVSGDLTRGKVRYELPMGERTRSMDALWDVGAMSQYATLSAVSESPLVEGLLYVGTDDGLVQVSEDGGATWRQATIPGAPDLAFVNDVQASLHDPNGVFVALDDHKRGDFRPRVFESRDRGRTWRSIAGDLPGETLVWAVAQDHEVEDLLFAGTEFGLYFTPDRGRRWIELTGNVPTIPFRDVAIHRGMDDLVAASFGRGFYVLDDYTPLRTIAGGALDRPAVLFPVREAWSYVPRVPMQAPGKPSQGSDDFDAPNPPFGALLTWYLKEAPQTAKEARQEGEKELAEGGKGVPFPGWERLREESLEGEPKVVITIRDAAGNPVRRLEQPAEAGLHRTAWELRIAAPDPISLEVPEFQPPWELPPQGPLAAAGTYTAEMALLTADGLAPLGEPQTFTVTAVQPATLPGGDEAAAAGFRAETRELLRVALGVQQELEAVVTRLDHLRAALADTATADPALYRELDAIRREVAGLRTRVIGDEVRGKWGEPAEPSVLDRLSRVAQGTWETRQEPTATHQASLAAARQELGAATVELGHLLETTLPAFEAKLEAAGARWTPGRKIGGS